MKKQTLIILILTLVLILTGCAGHAAEEETLHPLDAAAWPTPVPAQPTPPPTPFPKIGLEEVRVSYTPEDDSDTHIGARAPVEGVTEPAVEAPPSLANPATVGLASSSLDLAPLDSVRPVTQGQVNISAVNVRQGPSPAAAKQGILTSGQPVEVLGVNSTRDWTLIQTPTLSGWVSLAYIDLVDAVEAVPVISSGTAGASEAAADSVSQGPESTVSLVSAAADRLERQDNLEQTVTALGAVATANLAVSKTEVRPGPGTQFAAIDELTDPLERLTLVGVDPGRQWGLIEPEFETSRLGWVALSDVKIIEGDIAAAPAVYTGWTNSNALTLRNGPGIYSDEVGRLAINNLIRVVGLNEGHSWARVQPILGSGDGWTQIQYLTLSDNVANLPLAPVPPPPPAPASIDPFLAEASAKAAKEGKVALQLSSGGDIVTLNADGTGLETITHGLDPQLSPDGSRLAFTRWEGGEAGNGTLWVKDLNSGSETAVLGFIKQPKGPDWSPDGSRIVINYQHEGRLAEKHLNLDLTNHSFKVPWNAGNVRVRTEDGKPYLRYDLPPDPHWDLRVVDVTDGSFEDMDGGTYAFRPAWDPAQAWRIISDGGRGLLASDVNRADYQQQLTAQVGDGSPVFSPDGQYLAFSSGRGGDGYDIYRLNADGSGQVRLTQTPLWVAVTPEGQGHQWSNVSPAWSPDGTQIAFLTNRTGRWEVWVMNADGGNPRPMFAATVNDQLNFTYNFVDERVISWR